MGKFHIAAAPATAAALFLLLAGGSVRPARAEGSAVQLTGTIDAALAGAARAAGDPKSGLDPRNPKLAPFRSALAAMRARVKRIGSSLDQRDGEFFLLVDQGSTDLGELRVDWARTGVRNARIAAGIRTAAASYRTLRSTYGREGLRQRQGGPLSDAERRQLQRLQRAERRLAASLRLLRDQARRRGAAATAAELERFRAEAERIAWTPLDLGSYLNALITTSEMRGEWSADAAYVRKAASPQAWAAADETVQDLYADADIGQVFTVDLGKTPEAETAPEGETVADPAPGPVAGEPVEDAARRPADGIAGAKDPGDERDMDDVNVDMDEAAPDTETAVPVGAQHAAPSLPTAPTAPPQTAPLLQPAAPPTAPIPPPIG